MVLRMLLATLGSQCVAQFRGGFVSFFLNQDSLTGRFLIQGAGELKTPIRTFTPLI
jgi:hypothetical protein